MRKAMKKSGLTTVIIVSLAAMAFLPKNVAQWVVLAAIVVFAAVKGVSYYFEHRDDFAEKKEKIKSKTKKNKKSKPETEPILNYAITQLSHRVTDKLHSAFPEGSWHWVEKPTVSLFAEGGKVRIATSKTEEFNEADVILDTYGRIEVEMLKTDSVSKIIKRTDETADANYTVDAEAWYSQCAQKVLTDIITDLNAHGTKVLCIKKDGSMVVDDDKQVGTLKAFPSKNLWKKLVGIFEENGLMAVENEDSIELGW